MLTRFDAHAGVCNGKIINCDIALIYLIDGGDMLVEDCAIYNNFAFNLKTDYGATWNGEITVRNCTIKTKSETPFLINAIWTNHDYGYVCHYPSLEIDNLVLDGTKATRIYLDKTANQGDSVTKNTQISIRS